MLLPHKVRVKQLLRRVESINRDMNLKLSERECARMATLLCYLIDEGVDYESKPVLLQVVSTLEFQ